MTARPKVFCIGFHKTGTTSLYAALRELKFRVSGTIGHHWTAEQLRENGAQLCIDKAREVDAAEDMPWPHFFRELDEAFPGAKFILTTREPNAWFASIDRHFGEAATELNAFAYGRAHVPARGNKDHWIETMTRHNGAVRAYFADRPNDLLEMSLADGNGWETLCPFLGVAEPASPFPVKNTSAGRKSVAYRLKRRLWKFFGATPHPERLL